MATLNLGKVAFTYDDFTPEQLALLKGEKGNRGDRGERGETGLRGSRWNTGTAITGTSTSPSVFGNSGITDALVGDQYMNNSNGNIYSCVSGGSADIATWKYEMCLLNTYDIGTGNYKWLNIGTQQLNDIISIQENGQTVLVGVGNNGLSVKSYDGGKSWNEWCPKVTNNDLIAIAGDYNSMIALTRDTNNDSTVLIHTNYASNHVWYAGTINYNPDTDGKLTCIHKLPDGKFIAIDSMGNFYHGEHYQMVKNRATNIGDSITAIASSNERVVFVGDNGTFKYCMLNEITSSADTQIPIHNGVPPRGFSGKLKDVICATTNGYKFVAVGETGNVFESSDGVTWLQSKEEGNQIESNILAYGLGKYIALGNKGGIRYADEMPPQELMTFKGTWDKVVYNGIRDTDNIICCESIYDSIVAITDTGKIFELTEEKVTKTTDEILRVLYKDYLSRQTP